MSKQAKKTLVPKLRFPEFAGAEEWTERPLGNFIDELRKKSITQDEFEVLTSARIGLIRQRDYYDNNDRIADRKNIGFNIIPPNYLTYRSRSDDRRFFFNENNLGVTGIISSYYPVFRLIDPSNKFFVELLSFHSNTVGKHSVGTSQTVLSLNELKRITLPLPTIKEQQKIADCLSSVDELITAQAQKVGALKAHKKGLMQQLFPAEGETVPKLRFPEFRDAGEWEEIELGQLGKLVSGLTYSPDDVRDNGLLVLRSSNVQNGDIRLEDNVYVTPDIKGANLSKPNDILICVRNGSKALIGKNALIPEGMPLCTHGAFMTVFRSQSAKFVFQLFQTSSYQSHVDADLGATINSINGRHFIKYKFYVPQPPEQQKIADCLSSVDELITAQAKKLDTFKAHKKGLMQQLFPSVDDDCRDAGGASLGIDEVGRSRKPEPRATQDANAEVNG